MMATEHFGVALEAQPGKVEKGERIAVTNVEEEVRRTLVVTVLEQLGQRELKEVLVKADRPLDVAGDQRLMMHATC